MDKIRYYCSVEYRGDRGPLRPFDALFTDEAAELAAQAWDASGDHVCLDGEEIVVEVQVQGGRVAGRFTVRGETIAQYTATELPTRAEPDAAPQGAHA